MAIFNFRWPGKKEESEQAPMRRSRMAQAESVEDMRRRARHRLIGAAVLVVLGVIGFPILFDTQPRPIPVDVPIEIPDRNQVAPLMVPGMVAKGGEGLTQSQAVAGGGTDVDGALSDGEEMLDIAPPAPVAIPQPPEPPRLVPSPAIKPELKPEPAPAAERPIPQPAPEPKPLPPVEPKPAPKPVVDEAARARALLEGRAVPTAAPAAPAAAGRFIVQVGAFADAGKANEVRSKLERAGLKTYTQVVETKDGARTRVRVGPFNGRDDADKAAARIKSLGLAASVLTL